jgi:hypothetical protein
MIKISLSVVSTTVKMLGTQNSYYSILFYSILFYSSIVSVLDGSMDKDSPIQSFFLELLLFISCQPTERPLLVGEVVPTFAGRGCCVVSATDSHGRYLNFLDRNRYFFFQVAPPLSS